MEQIIKTKKLSISGMTCISCQNKIRKKLHGTAGVQSAKVSFNTGTALVTYDANIISLEELTSIINELDYRVLTGNGFRISKITRSAGLLFIIASLYIMLEHFGILNLLVPGRLAEAGMSYGMLLIIGLITSVHCVAMCGGINLSQCIPKGRQAEDESNLSMFRPTFLYNLGRIISYTAAGFIVGAFGSVITVSNSAQGAVKLISGVFMVIMGFNMLGIFLSLRKLNPKIPKLFSHKINKKKSSSNNPLYIGLLNGLMPCGPLQAMQIYALSTGNPFTGALSMFLFSLGTLPLMFGLGALSGALGKKFTSKAMTAGAILVAVLGLSMFTQGLSLSGLSLPFASNMTASRDGGETDTVNITEENGVQIVNSTLLSNRYPSITVVSGTPVKWIIDAPQGSINGCNNRLFINEYGIEYRFTYGENIIEFTPTKTGTFQYSCWMGMIRATINVSESGE